MSIISSVRPEALCASSGAARIGGLTPRQRDMHFGGAGPQRWASPGHCEAWGAEFARINAAHMEEEALAYQRLLSGKPEWWFDRGFLNCVALEFLPRVAAALDFTMACAEWGPGEVRWWPEGEPGHVIMLAGQRDAVVYIDQASGYWISGGMRRRGADLVELGAARWRTGETKAAWRLAKLCGLRRPHQ